jgi:hypothetical protein
VPDPLEAATIGPLSGSNPLKFQNATISADALPAPTVIVSTIVAIVSAQDIAFGLCRIPSPFLRIPMKKRAGRDLHRPASNDARPTREL